MVSYAELSETHPTECDVSVVVVTYNSAAAIPPFLSALPAALEGVQSARVVVVDNASSDGTASLVRALAPWVCVVEAGANLGYGAAINIGMRAAPFRQGVLVLNPDAVPTPGSVAVLLQAAAADDRTGLAVPKIVNARGDLKFSLRREPTLLRAVGEAVVGGHRAARFAPFGDMIRNPRRYYDGATADWATGAAMFLTRAALDAAGSWDESFFLYSEETDYALRVRDAGLRLRYIPAAVVFHPGGEMSRNPQLWTLVAVNRVRLYRKRHGALASAAYWAVVVANEATRALLGRPTHRAALRALLRHEQRFGRGGAITAE